MFDCLKHTRNIQVEKKKRFISVITRNSYDQIQRYLMYAYHCFIIIILNFFGFSMQKFV